MTALTTQNARAARGIQTEGRSPEELRELVSHWGAELELAPAETIIEWAAATFGEALDMDVIYAHSWSLGLDLKLLCITPVQLLRKHSTA